MGLEVGVAEVFLYPLLDMAPLENGARTGHGVGEALDFRDRCIANRTKG